MNAVGLQWGHAHRAVTSGENRGDQMLAKLKSLPLFCGLSDTDLDILIAESRRRAYQEGEMLMYQGEPGSTCHILVEGRVRIFLVGEDGRELAVRILGPGEIVGEMALFEALPRSANVQALAPARTLELDEDTLLRCLRRSPGLAFGLLRAMSARLRSTTEDAEGLVSLPVQERLLRQLQRLASWSGCRVADGVRIVPPMTQQELASLVGTSRESVNRALVRLRREGKVRLEEGWIILLEAGLEA
mgnify:CR=1 FL=1